MTETDFLARADATLAAIEAALDATGADIEVNRAGNVVTLELADDSRVVINTQTPTRQIWVAARSGGFHFGWEEQSGAWLDTRGGGELFASLSRIISVQGGAPVLLRAP
jgi:CyaY protein